MYKRELVALRAHWPGHKKLSQVKTSASRLELQMPQIDSIVGEAGATTHTLRLPHKLKNKDHQGRATSLQRQKQHRGQCLIPP